MDEIEKKIVIVSVYNTFYSELFSFSTFLLFEKKKKFQLKTLSDREKLKETKKKTKNADLFIISLMIFYFFDFSLKISYLYTRLL